MFTKFYYADGQRIAQRVGGAAPTYTLTDHLGSTRYTLNQSGAKTAEMRYYPWGSTHYSSNPAGSPRRQYTGQMNDGDTGLYYYNARYYEPGLARFVQADTIVPNASNPQSYNRYAYVRNSPINFNDPTGHYECSSHELDGEGTDYCYGVKIDPTFSAEEIALIIQTLKDYAGILGGEQAFFDNVFLDAINVDADDILDGQFGERRTDETTGESIIWLKKNLLNSNHFSEKFTPVGWFRTFRYSKETSFKFILAHEIGHALQRGNGDTTTSFRETFMYSGTPKLFGMIPIGSNSLSFTPVYSANWVDIYAERFGETQPPDELMADAIAAYLYVDLTGWYYAGWIENTLPSQLE